MSIDPAATPRTRRSLLLGAFGALGALAIGSVARPDPTSAQVQYVQLGGDSIQDETGSTVIRNLATNTSGLQVEASGPAAITASHKGTNGYFAIQGYSYHHTGVEGYAIAAGQTGVRGRASGGTGVLGFSGPSSATVPAARAKTGVYGVASQDASAVGVYGKSTTGRGGVFTGKLANLRLPPSSAASHPAAGQPGDVFVDASYRLWFCLGGATWKRVQLV